MLADQQQAAIRGVIAANAIYRQADAHRTEMLGLAKSLGCSGQWLMEALEIKKNKDDS
jgi:hypothetical protein